MQDLALLGYFDSGLVDVRARGRSASPARDGRGGRLHMSRGAISFSFLLLFSLAAWELASSPALGRASLACAPALRASIFLGLPLAALRVELPAQAAQAMAPDPTKAFAQCEIENTAAL